MFLHSMAEDAVDAAIKSGRLKPTNGCVTEHLRIVGGDGWDPALFAILSQHYICMKKARNGKVIPAVMDTAVSKHLSHSYGTLAERVATIAQVENFFQIALVQKMHMYISSSYHPFLSLVKFCIIV